MSVDLKEFRASNDILGDAGALRRRVDEEGYLFFRRLIEPQVIRDIRSRAFEVFREAGWLSSDAPLADGIANTSHTCVEGDAEYWPVYNNLQKLESWHRLALSPAIMSVMENIFDEPVMAHFWKVGRIMFPQNTTFMTPAHQDWMFNQGTTETYTCWMPIGDCPRELGGLTILPGTHKKGLYEYYPAYGTGGITVHQDDMRGHWLTTDFEAGDALVFHSLNLHRSLPNLTPDRLRFSADFRYQAASQPMAEDVFGPHGGVITGLTWEEIYDGWESDDGKYYWTDFDIKTIPRDNTRLEKRTERLFEQARAGDENMRPILNRMLKQKRYYRAEMVEAASQALQILDEAGATKK